jgi:hypothetical protein
MSTCDGADFLNDGVRAGTCNRARAMSRATATANRGSSFGVTVSARRRPGPPRTSFHLTHTNDGVATATVTATGPMQRTAGQDLPLRQLLQALDDRVHERCDVRARRRRYVHQCRGHPATVNACLDDSSSAEESLCAPTVGDGAECPFAPVDQTCAIDTFRGCIDNLDCSAPNDHCVSNRRRCYPGYDGNVGDTVTSTGEHQTPLDHAGTATLASVFCVAPTTSAATNFVHGLPGPGRIALAGVMTDDGTATTCPTHATFLPTSKNGGWDVGWMGLAHGGRAVGQGKVTMSVSGCANAIPPCGVCNYTGPVENVNVAP